MVTSTTSATTSSNIDVAGIVSQLMTVEQRPLTLLAQKEASYNAKLTAYGSIKGAVSSFSDAMSGLSDISKLQALTATSSDTSAATVTASSTAVAGSYSLNVTTLAQAQKLAAAGQTSQTSAIGTGTLTFDFGTITGGTLNASGKYDAPGGGLATSFDLNGNGTKTVTIGASNNTLQGIRDAINSAKIGVTATIVNDGSASPYRLVLSSDSMGKNNSIRISVAGDPALSNLLAHDPTTTTQNLAETATATNAVFKLNGIDVTKNSNTVTDAIQGVTLNLLKAPTATPVNVTVVQDTSAVNTAAANFVKAYNDLNTALRSNSSYDAATKKGGILQGDSVVLTLEAQVRAILNTAVSNTSGSLTTLSQIGVAFQQDGTLKLDTAKLNTAISNNFNDIKSLFAAVGSTTDSMVAYSSATTNTKSGSYAVNITQMATQGGVTGNVNLIPGTTIAAGTAVNVTLDGTTALVPLTAGVGYTPAALAAMIQSAINGVSAFSALGSSVTATTDGVTGFMTLTSNRYGGGSNISMADGAGTPVANFGMGVAGTAGVDVTGTIGGGAALGIGQFLTSTAGNATDLKIQISGGTTGARGTINYSQGYAYLLNQFATSMLASDGPLDNKTKGISTSITSIGKQRDALNLRLASIQKNYIKQFSALDAMLGSMNSTSSFLTQQLSKL